MDNQDQRIVMILGAGATIADCMGRTPAKRPPLDRGFFSDALKTHGPQLYHVREYMKNNYGVDIKSPREDSLERIMAAIYTDSIGGPLEREAFDAFRTLVKAFLSRLASTTNTVEMTRRCRLYRLIVQQLERCRSPDNLAIVTFNQDIQIEKALHAISGTKTRLGQRTFAFPGCYRLAFKGRLTAPRRNRGALFGSDRDFFGVSLLKLHGSLNWYSAHNTPNPSKRAIFDPRRTIGITRRQAIDTGMLLTTLPKKAKFTFPIVIPPVVNKAGILHHDLQAVWSEAEERLRAADRVIVFGYSCPINDWESANLISRSLTANATLREFSVIDPDPGVTLRYAGLGDVPSVSWYRSCEDYLTAE